MSANGSGPERWIVIPRWEEFQHRDAARANVPTWLKVFTKLLGDDDYRDLSGHRRAILHGIWLEYARSTRRLRLDTLSLTRRLGLRVTMTDLAALNHAGFIELSASRPASNLASTSASTEKNREEESREEQLGTNRSSQKTPPNPEARPDARDEPPPHTDDDEPEDFSDFGYPHEPTDRPQLVDGGNGYLR